MPKRTHNVRLIRREHSYSIQEVAALYGLHKNAIGRWLKSGLKAIDRSRPILIHGSDLIHFLTERQHQRKAHCKAEEFYCLRCRAPRLPMGNMADLIPRNEKLFVLHAFCALCGGAMRKVSGQKKLLLYQQIFDLATPAGTHLTETPETSLNRALKEECKNAPKHPRL
jgi:hypothetical protein